MLIIGKFQHGYNFYQKKKKGYLQLSCKRSIRSTNGAFDKNLKCAIPLPFGIGDSLFKFEVRNTHFSFIFSIKRC